MQTHQEELAEERARPSRARVPYTAPLAIPVREACRVGGFGNTTAWRLIKEGKLQVVRVSPRRLLVVYASLVALLTPEADGGGTSRPAYSEIVERATREARS